MRDAERRRPPRRGGPSSCRAWCAAVGARGSTRCRRRRCRPSGARPGPCRRRTHPAGHQHAELGQRADLPAAQPVASAAARLSAERPAQAPRQVGQLGLPPARQRPHAHQETTGAISGANTVSKYGGPTEILPIPAHRAPADKRAEQHRARRHGQQHVVGEQQRLARHGREAPPRPTWGARPAYSISEPPIASTRKARMNSPRCDRWRTRAPKQHAERTRKVPSSLSENARIASSRMSSDLNTADSRHRPASGSARCPPAMA